VIVIIIIIIIVKITESDLVISTYNIYTSKKKATKSETKNPTNQAFSHFNMYCTVLYFTE